MTIYFKPNKYKTDFLWSVGGSYFYAGAQWLFLILLARSLHASDVGEFSYWISIYSPIVLFFNLKLRSVLATDSNNQYSITEYFSLRLLAMIFVYALIVVIIIVKAYDKALVVLLGALGLSKITESLSDILHGVMQKFERHDLVAISRISKGVMQIGIFLLTSTCVDGLDAAAISLMIASALSYFFIDRMLLQIGDINELREHKNVDFVNIRILAMIKLSLPLGIATASGTLLENMPKYYINNYFGSSQLGYYSMVAAVVVIGSTVVAALAQVASPRMAILFSTGKITDFNHLTSQNSLAAVIFGFVMVVLTIIFGELFLSKIYGVEYATQNYILVCLMAAFAIRAAFVFYGTAIQCMRVFDMHYKIDICMLGVMAVLLYVSINLFEFNGVLYAIVVASIFEGIVYYYFYVKMLNKALCDAKNRMQ